MASFDPGSLWHRWDPHIHAPGTVLNDGYGHDDPWEEFFAKIEAASPTIRALGITDYYVLDRYERVREARRQGRLPTCDLVFPNIEMRLDVGPKARFINVHLLVRPDDDGHILEVQRFLSRLTFDAFGDTFACDPADLMRLGRKSDPSLTESQKMLERGVQQFKVSFAQLRQVYFNSDWAKANILVAVAANKHDGTSGLQDGSDATQRQEIERFAHVIFSSNPKQRTFWLGHGSLTREDIIERYGGLKPCLHGSDAHAAKDVSGPSNARYTWIKGAVHFDALWQACIDPEWRSWIGDERPTGAPSSQTISHIRINGAPWATTNDIQLNPGLVAVIGARGSGKTALADMIAVGCDAFTHNTDQLSFIARAAEYLEGSTVTLHWADGTTEERSLLSSTVSSYPRARYLSQHFVESLCAADGITDALLDEIHRVIFEAHTQAHRDGAVDFEELLSVRTERPRANRRRLETALAKTSESISAELDNQRLLPTIKEQLAQKNAVIVRYAADRRKLSPVGDTQRIVQLEELSNAADHARRKVRTLLLRHQDLVSARDEVNDFRTNVAPEDLRLFRARHEASALSTDEWQHFLTDFKGNVNAILDERIVTVGQELEKAKGAPPQETSNVHSSMLIEGVEYAAQPLSRLEAEIARLQKLVAIDKQTANAYAAITKRITEETSARDQLAERLKHCEGAKQRAEAFSKERQTIYQSIFDQIICEEQVLSELYTPLRERLNASNSSIRKLKFTVSRYADVERWADEGEQILDLRRAGAFRGRGELGSCAEQSLKAAWERGTSNDASQAMHDFLKTHQEGLLKQLPVQRGDTEYRRHAQRLAQWLYSTEHIRVRYGVEYDGVDIRKLSPGTRGIILLLLYLALDDTDDRPLIIDQPEENLDPQSIFDELVGLFASARHRRQVIVITHNANLVVNTDADQVIVARVRPYSPGSLPPINYVGGGLDDFHIRTAVCDLLEGGRQAFQERARRLRLPLRSA